ncbi:MULTISPECIES: lytic polysaccharide monooxygenase [unclassified Streptomyces]|uniref:lytic polysaccharide monooxygenase auxiliary activity family 9 protein n=1 Tax=unclassified Streptomyces TaxID=2593676 RepID=UPI000DBA2AAE|nr:MULTISPECIES: lytic polysaccharide monooxygenase [unclassified Streptomyces]MYT72829.1 LPXTG cell wall anchor domain-containing protein [Streptomyces sp. SID8367]RAJ78805.1 LPXTG-motif cell wall-anchored protein [Streptomyces sp. PsTaAH-137]
MPTRRTLTALTAVASGATALAAFSATPAAAHGTLGDPVSRVAACYAEGAENPASAACKAAVAAGGSQALYDWNGIRIGDAGGQHQAKIPDGKLCSANSEEFKGMDLARDDWPATKVSAGAYTFKYKVTAQHKGTFNLYVTKQGYDASKPLAWSDLDLEHPVATKTDPVAEGGYYTFSGTLPERTGRQLVYGIWQRSDSPEAFYSCSDVTYGGSSGSGSTGEAAAPAASAPSDEQIAEDADKSTVDHSGMDMGGDGDTATAHEDHGSASPSTEAAAASTDGNTPSTDGSSERLAETGGDATTSYIAIGGAAALTIGAAGLFASVRRRAVAGGGRHSR